MITREQIEEAFGENKHPFKTKDVDHDIIAITLLRDRIPYDVCKNIIRSAAHGVIYLCSVDSIVEYLSEEDLAVLADCNVWIDEDMDCLGLFI